MVHTKQVYTLFDRSKIWILGTLGLRQKKVTGISKEVISLFSIEINEQKCGEPTLPAIYRMLLRKLLLRHHPEHQQSCLQGRHLFGPIYRTSRQSVENRSSAQHHYTRMMFRIHDC